MRLFVSRRGISRIGHTVPDRELVCAIDLAASVERELRRAVGLHACGNDGAPSASAVARRDFMSSVNSIMGTL